MMNQTKTVSAIATQQINAAPARVFDAWITPELLGKWMMGENLRDEEVIHLQVDARVGGAFSFLVRRQGQELDHIGKYLELDRPHRLVFTWGIRGESEGDSRVIVEIAPLNSGCQVTVTHEMDAKWAEFVDRSAASWAKMIRALAETVGETIEGNGA